jgi:hypothetical protein
MARACWSRHDGLMAGRELVIATPPARDAAIATLQEHYARNHVDVEEFERRVVMVESARTQPEIERALAGLPVLADVERALVRAGRTTTSMRALFSNIDRRGEHRVPSLVKCAAIFGNIDLDLSTAVLGTGETEIQARAVFGNVTIHVPEGLRVECEGAAIFGTVTELHAGAASLKDDRVVRVRGTAVFGTVDIVVVKRQQARGLLAAVKDMLIGR